MPQAGLAHTFVLQWGAQQLPELKTSAVSQYSTDQSWIHVGDILEEIERKLGAALEDTIPGSRELPL